MKTAFLLFPNGLFKDTAALKQCRSIYLIEEFLFFRLYKFHKQKLVFHRASMQAYKAHLEEAGLAVEYIPATDTISDIRKLIPFLQIKGYAKLIAYDPCDEWLQKRMIGACAKCKMDLELIENPLFINSSKEIEAYAGRKKNYFQTDFYVQQRKDRKILVNEKLLPIHGKWSFDAENRLKYPKAKQPPRVDKNYLTPYHSEAVDYVEEYFGDNYAAALASFLLSNDASWITGQIMGVDGGMGTLK